MTQQISDAPLSALDVASRYVQTLNDAALNVTGVRYLEAVQ